MKGSCVSCICSSGNENGQCENKRVNINTSIADKHRASFKQIFLRSVLSKIRNSRFIFYSFHACSGKWANEEGFAKCAHRNAKLANLFSCFICGGEKCTKYHNAHSLGGNRAFNCEFKRFGGKKRKILEITDFLPWRGKEEEKYTAGIFRQFFTNRSHVSRIH